MKIFLTAVVFVALTLGAAIIAAEGALAAPKLNQAKLDGAASLVAGHPVRVDCVTSAAAWLRGPAPQALGYQWAHEPGEIHLGPYVCEALRDPRSPLFGGGLHVLAHEAAHARGIESESLASCYGLVWPRHLAWRFWGVPMFSQRSYGIDWASTSIHETTPPEYRGGC